MATRDNLVPAASRPGYRPASMGEMAGFTTQLRSGAAGSTSFPTGSPARATKPFARGTAMKVRKRKTGSSRGTALSTPRAQRDPALAGKPRFIVPLAGTSLGLMNGSSV